MIRQNSRVAGRGQRAEQGLADDVAMGRGLVPVSLVVDARAKDGSGGELRGLGLRAIQRG